jgi:hypothetical protein
VIKRSLLLLACLLTACAGPTFHERARITSMPTDVSRTLVLQVDYETFSGDAKPGATPGQTIVVTSATGKRLTCTFRTGSWRYDGPGTCVDPNGGQYDMIFDRNALPGL